MASKTIITKEKAAPFPLITIVEVDSEDVIPEGKSAPVPIITVVEVDSDTIISDEKTAPLPIITITNVASEEITSNEDAAPIPLPDSPRAHTSTSSLAKSLLLFSRTDINTFIVTVTFFGILGALSGPLLTTNSSPDVFSILARTPSVAFFVWINVLVFELANQTQSKATIEESVDKPNLSIPSGLISSVQGRRLLFTILPLFVGVSYPMGVWKETALQFILAWKYNDLEGGEKGSISRRNAIIAAAFGIFNEGALQVACGYNHTATETGFVWNGVVSGVILTAMHAQEMKADQAGDNMAIARQTAATMIGDGIVRWTIAVPVLFWSLLCPLYWDIGLYGWFLPVSMGLMTAVPVLRFRDLVADYTTWLWWAKWLSSAYLLSLLKNQTAIENWTRL